MNKTLNALLKTETDNRLLRLLAVGCCYQIWDLLKDERSRTAVEVAEKYADRQTTKKELRKASAASWTVAHYAAHAATYNTTYNVVSAYAHASAHASTHDAARYAANTAAYDAANAVAYDAANAVAYDAANAVAYDAARAVVRKRQLELYHCIFTKIVFTTTSPNAINLAKLIYEERQWNLMPILGDALEEVGSITEVVSHCKEKEHARGCWVVDNFLGHRR